MQFDSMIQVFDSTEFTREHPLSPEGVLFTYYPLLEPEALHYHNFLEIGYCECGTGLFYVDGEVVPFCGPCCSIIYGGQTHIAQSVNAEKSLWHFLYIDLQMLFQGADALPLGGLKALSPHLYDFPSLLQREADPTLYALCELVLAEAAGGKPDFLIAVRGLMTAMLARHSRYMTPARHVRREQKQILDRLGSVMTYINRHYMEEMTVPDLARAGGVSKATLQRDFLAFTGMAPLKYIHYLRMKRAAAMLLDKSVSVAQIAYAVGYSSLSSFNRHFSAEFAVSPTQWRRAQTTG